MSVDRGARVQARVERTRPYPFWREDVWKGRVPGYGDVLILRGPEFADPSDLQRARQELSALSLQHPRILVPQQVYLDQERLGWVYPDGKWLALSRVLHASPARLPLGAAVRVVAEVAEVLVEVGPRAVAHGGPTPADLLVDTLGNLKITGFIEPVASTLAMRDPAGSVGEKSVVYRLGCLLSWLCSCQDPNSGADADTHEAEIRRALIRVMSRPGPVISESFSSLFRAMRAWNPEDRPTLAVASEQLRGISEELDPRSLKAWARQHVFQTISPGIDEEEDPTTFFTAIASPVERTDPSHAVTPRPPRDDSTEESQPFAHWEDSTPEHAGAAPAAFGMPVRVGPPPEAVKHRPALPSGFLDKKGTPVEEISEDGVAAPGRVPPSAPSVLVLTALLFTSLALIGAATVLLVYLFEPSPRPPTPGERPRIGEVLDSRPGDTRVLVVRNPSGASLTVTCGDSQVQTRGDAILPTLANACTVRATLGDDTSELSVEMTGIVEISCFDEVASCTTR